MGMIGLWLVHGEPQSPTGQFRILFVQFDAQEFALVPHAGQADGSGAEKGIQHLVGGL